MICPKCNTENEEANMLCKSCGSILNKEEVDKQTGNVTATPFSVHNEEASRVIQKNKIEENNKAIEKTFAKKYVKYKVIKTLIILIVLGLIGFIGKKGYDYYFDYNSNPYDLIFMSDDNNLYAAYSVQGKKLTEYIFSEVDTEENSYTLVKRESDNRTLIIGSDGKYTVDEVDYIDFTRMSNNTFLVTKKDNSKALITGDNKTILSGDLSLISGSKHLLLNTTKDKYIIVSIEGKELLSLSRSEEKLVTSYSNNYVSIYYDNNCYFFEDDKLISSIDSTKLYTLISSTDETLLLSEDTYTNCRASTFTNCIAFDNTYKLYRNGVETTFEDNTGIYTLRDNYLEYVNKDITKIYSLDLELLVNGVNMFTYIDDTHYAYEYNNKVTINNDSKEEVIENAELILSKDYYIVKVNNIYKLIDKNNKILKEYDSIEYLEVNNESYFKVSKSNKYNILDNKINFLTEDFHDDIDIIYTIRGIVISITDNNTYLLDLDKNLKLGSYDNIKELNYNMYILEDDDTITYHSYLTPFKFNKEKKAK